MIMRLIVASPMNSDSLKQLSIRDLARMCMERAGHWRTLLPGTAPCYELFRRAFESAQGNEAWEAILNQYRRLVAHWLGQYASEDTIQEVFVHFWQAQKNADAAFSTRFPNIRAVMGYLKLCALSVRFDAGRAVEQQRILQEHLRNAAQLELVLMRSRPEHSDVHFKQFVVSFLKDERERVVFELTYYYGLAPREIQAERPDLFPNTRVVHRVKENLLKRLRRSQELKDLWFDR